MNNINNKLFEIFEKVNNIKIGTPTNQNPSLQGASLMGGKIEKITTPNVKDMSPYKLSISVQFVYDPKQDSFNIQVPVSKTDAEILSKIAMSINRNSKYKDGVGDLNIF